MMDQLDGGPVAHAVDFKGIDPDVSLGQLVAFASGVPWNTRG